MRRNETGAVTAETAMALPLITIFALSMAWLVSIGITDARAIDAARETARAAARATAGEAPRECVAAASLGVRRCGDQSKGACHQG